MAKTREKGHRQPNNGTRRGPDFVEKSGFSCGLVQILLDSLPAWSYDRGVRNKLGHGRRVSFEERIMPARAAWKGFLHVNQLQVPVKAFTACSTQPEIALNQLHRGCGERIQQHKVCPVHGPLTADDIISGYQYAEGRFLPLEAADLEPLLPEDQKAITVDAFVSSTQIDPVYHSGRTYYVVPDGPPGQRPFCVLRDGLRQRDRHGVARVVMSGRELLVVLRPLGRLVAMTVLEYPQRVRSSLDYEGEVAGLTVSEAEQQLIRQLMDAMTDGDLDLTRYRDRYIDGLNALIERRLADVAPLPENGSLRVEADEANLVAALRASLAAAGVDDVPARIPSRTQRSTTGDDEQPARRLA
uniref:Ku domain-containing protein n=1 Tax=Schlesneria paludicola TaxID=360056 RepID=A0A7C2P4G0_9PLAN